MNKSLDMAIYIHNNGIDHNNEAHISEIIKFLNMKFNYKHDIKYNSEIKCIVPNNMIMLDYYKDRMFINLSKKLFIELMYIFVLNNEQKF